MPVEIKELIIKANITTNNDNTESRDDMTSYNKNEIIRSCVEEVLRILEVNNER